MNRTLPKTEIERTAHHEAGHAVCYLVQRRRFKYVTIKPGEGTLGHCHAAGVSKSLHQDVQFEQSSRARRWIDAQALIFAAGNIAERFFAKKRIVAGSHQDFISIYDLFSRVTADTDEVSALFALTIIRTRNLLLQPFNWVMVQAVAESLLERQTLTYREAQAIAKQAQDRLLNDTERLNAMWAEVAEYHRRFPFRFAECVWRAEV